MANHKKNLIGVFATFTSIESVPHFKFITREGEYLVDCLDLIKRISDLFPGDKVKLEGDIGPRLSGRIKLLNPKCTKLDKANYYG